MKSGKHTGPGILLLVSAIWFFAKFIRYIFPPLFPQFQDFYGISNSLLGSAFTGMMLVYAVSQFPAGVVADRIGSARVITAGVGIAALISLAMSMSVPLILLVGGMLFIGLGTGIHKTVAVNFLSTLYPDRHGRALGLHDTFGAFGGVVAPVVVVAAMSGPGWRILFLASGVVAIVLASLFWVQTPDDVKATRPASDQLPFSAYRDLLSDFRFNAFLLVTITSAFAYSGVTAFLPLYLTSAAGLESSLASLLYSVLFAVSLVQLVTGELSDRFSLLTVIVGTLALATIGLCGLLIGNSPLSLGVSVIVLGLGSHGFRPLRGVHLVNLIPDSLAGGGLGVARTILMGAGATSPAVIGFVSESADFHTAFSILLGANAIAVLIATWLLATSES